MKYDRYIIRIENLRHSQFLCPNELVAGAQRESMEPLSVAVTRHRERRRAPSAGRQGRARRGRVPAPPGERRGPPRARDRATAAGDCGRQMVQIWGLGRYFRVPRSPGAKKNWEPYFHQKENNKRCRMKPGESIRINGPFHR